MDSVLIIVLLVLAVYHFKFRSDTRRGRETAPKFIRKDSSDQLRFVMAAPFHKKKLMNKSEYRVFRVIEGLVRSSNKGHRVFAQTSLGEVIGSNDQRAFDSINSKRVDFLIIDPFGHPAVAVEYQGDGHYQGDAAARDAVKREALRKAGVAYVEILHGDDDEGVKRKVLEALG